MGWSRDSGSSYKYGLVVVCVVVASLNGIVPQTQPGEMLPRMDSGCARAFFPRPASLTEDDMHLTGLAGQGFYRKRARVPLSGARKERLAR